VLAERTGIASDDLIVSMVENAKEHWSFTGGRAQFLDRGAVAPGWCPVDRGRRYLAKRVVEKL